MRMIPAHSDSSPPEVYACFRTLDRLCQVSQPTATGSWGPSTLHSFVGGVGNSESQQMVGYEPEDGRGDVRCSNPFPFGDTLPYLGHSFPSLTPI